MIYVNDCAVMNLASVQKYENANLTENMFFIYIDFHFCSEELTVENEIFLLLLVVVACTNESH